MDRLPASAAGLFIFGTCLATWVALLRVLP